MKKSPLNGINLEIDRSIEETCRVANESTRLTRSVLYVLIFVSGLASLSLWNSRRGSWNLHRQNAIKNSLLIEVDSLRILNKKIQDLAILDMQSKKSNDSIDCNVKLEKLNHDILIMKENIYYKRSELDKILKVITENDRRVHIPVLGTSLDINDLGAVTGLSLSILLLILLFTFGREYTNLMVAFISITERYTDFSNANLFKKTFKNLAPNEQKNFVSYDDFLKQVNKTRRKHHYNYLSMNEIFTLPPMSNNIQHTSSKRVLAYLVFLIPFTVQLVIFFYDFFTRELGFKLDVDSTLITIMLDAVFGVIITTLTYMCLKKKYQYANLWDEFYSNQFKYRSN
ncbi:MAG: hypothetical protein ACOVP1_01075 [Bacteroidia bacterium]